MQDNSTTNPPASTLLHRTSSSKFVVNEANKSDDTITFSRKPPLRTPSKTKANHVNFRLTGPKEYFAPLRTRSADNHAFFSSLAGSTLPSSSSLMSRLSTATTASSAPPTPSSKRHGAAQKPHHNNSHLFSNTVHAIKSQMNKICGSSSLTSSLKGKKKLARSPVMAGAAKLAAILFMLWILYMYQSLSPPYRIKTLPSDSVYALAPIVPLAANNMAALARLSTGQSARESKGDDLDSSENNRGIGADTSLTESELLVANAYLASDNKTYPIIARTPLTVARQRVRTDAGVPVQSERLYEESVSYGGRHGDRGSSAVIIGMMSSVSPFIAHAPTEDALLVYQRFVGSLRKSGYRGRILLGVVHKSMTRNGKKEPADVDAQLLTRYLRARNVTVQNLLWTECVGQATTNSNASKLLEARGNGRLVKSQTACVAPYPDLKLQWSRYPLAKEWLEDCKDCDKGPVLLVDVRETLFQQNPFETNSTVKLQGLQLFEEEKSRTTLHWLTDLATRGCKGVRLNQTKLTSGAVLGTRVAMIQYLTIMHEEMKMWAASPKCRFSYQMDDQAIHNYLFYTGQIPFATAVPNGEGLVLNVGVQGEEVVRQHVDYMAKQYQYILAESLQKPFQGAWGNRWIGEDFNLTNSKGLFVQADGSTAKIVHGFDRFGPPFLELWLRRQGFAQDEVRGDELLEKLAPRPVPSGANARVKRQTTDTGINIEDPLLFLSESNSGSENATVIGVAYSSNPKIYRRFVGTLRQTGYRGHIILGIPTNLPGYVIYYLKKQKVEYHLIKRRNCSHSSSGKMQGNVCVRGIPDIKLQWSRFQLAKEWLNGCSKCAGPVLFVDVRDTIFQQDPFGFKAPAIKGLQLYQEHTTRTTQHWITKLQLGECKSISLNESLHTAGAVTGTRAAMLTYLNVVHAEMKEWMKDPDCQFELGGDDRTLINWLYYSGQLPFARSIPFRSGGIVLNLNVVAANIMNHHINKMSNKFNISKQKAANRAFEGLTGKSWLPTEYGLTDENGFFVEKDSSRARVIHQFDRFGPHYTIWLKQQTWFQDGFDYSDDDDLYLDGDTKNLPKANSRNFDAHGRRWRTDGGVVISDPQLYEGIDLNGDSSTATVIGLAVGYDMEIFKRFVGSLRKSRYKGNIIMGIASDSPQNLINFLKNRKVVIKYLNFVDCAQEQTSSISDLLGKGQCLDPYNDLKLRWSRFPLARDWLEECEACTGPALLIDVRDSFFQLDPFGFGSPMVKGLHVFQAHANLTTQHSLTKRSLGECKNIEYDEPLLCPGTTVGTRIAMLRYLEAMYAEMRLWIKDPKCHLNADGDEQSIHNHLFYSGQLPFATSIPHRKGSIVNNVGFEGEQIVKQHTANLLSKGKTYQEAMQIPFEGAVGKRYIGKGRWIGKSFNLVDDKGFFTELDGSWSRAVHQYDRFSRPFVDLWLDKQNY